MLGYTGLGCQNSNIAKSNKSYFLIILIVIRERTMRKFRNLYSLIRRKGSDLSFSQLGSLFGFFKFLLSFSVLGQVEGSNFFCFLDLLLVGLDLSLQLLGQIRHAVLVLLVFILLELQFLDAPC